MSSRRLGVLLALLLLVGCTTSGPGPAAPSPTPEPSPAPLASASPTDGLSVAVVLPPTGLRTEAEVEAAREAVEAMAARHRPGLSSLRAVQPDAEAFTRDVVTVLAERGSQLVCVLGPGAGDAVLAVAPSFPRTRFCAFPALAEPAEIPSNVLLVDLRVEELAYLAGAAAQLTSVSGPPGFVAGPTTYGVERQRAAFQAGANAVAGERVVPFMTPAAVDAETAEELAASRYATGLDTIYTRAGAADIGVRRAAAAAGGLVIGSLLTLAGGPSSPAPATVLMATTEHPEVGLEVAVERALGEWEGGLASVGLAEDALAVEAGGSDRYAAIAATVERLRGRIVAREVAPLESR